MVIASIHTFIHSQGCQEEGVTTKRVVVAVVRSKPDVPHAYAVRCVVRLFTMRIR